MATAMTAPAAGAVVDESNRDGATAADRDLEKLNALENWAHIQSSLENKQACVSSFFFWLANSERNKNQPKKRCSPGEGETMGMTIDKRKEREKVTVRICFCVCLVGILFGTSSSQNCFSPPDLHTPRRVHMSPALSIAQSSELQLWHHPHVPLPLSATFTVPAHLISGLVCRQLDSLSLTFNNEHCGFPWRATLDATSPHTTVCCLLPAAANQM